MCALPVVMDLTRYPVLFVDDDFVIATTLRYLLPEGKFKLLTASSGAEALAILAKQEIALLLTDQRMPGMTGVELCARARQIRPELVTMIITAYADIQAVIDAINRGHVSAYLAKPWRNTCTSCSFRAPKSALLRGRRDPSRVGVLLVNAGRPIHYPSRKP